MEVLRVKQHGVVFTMTVETPDIDKLKDRNAKILEGMAGVMLERDKLKTQNKKLVAALYLADCILPRLIREASSGYDDDHEALKAVSEAIREAKDGS